MESSSITVVEHGELTTTEGQTFTFNKVIVPQTYKKYPQFYGVPNREEGVSVRVEVAWEHLVSVVLTNPDDLLGLPEWFHLYKVPLIVNGTDVRGQAKHYNNGQGVIVHTLPRKKR
jgi:hypothetical protein